MNKKMCKVFLVPDRTRETLDPLIEGSIHPQCRLILSDGWAAYIGIE